MNEPIFKINFNKWSLLTNPETGLLTEPEPIEEFDCFDYWSNEFNRPVRQVICKDRSSHYADYLDLDTATLRRRVSSTLGWSAYDDEIDKNSMKNCVNKFFLSTIIENG